MDETQLIKICIIITFIGVALFFITYKNEFEEKTISQMIASEDGTKGIIYGKVNYILQNEPSIFFVQNDEKIKIFSNKKLDLNFGETLVIYGEITTYNGEKEIIAYKVIKQ
ncbi:MAG: hypothetical protein WC915_03045 [archaeon]|jgi:hypothetical protein